MVLWQDGNVHVDGREFGPSRDAEGEPCSALENAEEFLRHHYNEATKAAALQNATDFTGKRGKR